ncbi:uncharacterized protein L969DRAFT_24204 [Mixia osmundae IAM 14324]|uniref:Autophagy-related protein 14 n=1 Tax=Mixia osmundae (strain CBS 9802 / IAM 14324 / JCM 22182 / KY 12970) TaxID=764103 RepID=G7DYX4_MIXOS|nr:uncharacterized protein L969DRAFT_24204 [Mixia osmundae IAM 14324]KEI38616.1 hypothetical protein L969DRAFT_24204 [Mixia osmundae IAM 14324]GAA95784.1 hypothetical protein E5Q_02441 [Mixia osmundae IAM 14324]
MQCPSCDRHDRSRLLCSSCLTAKLSSYRLHLKQSRAAIVTAQARADAAYASSSLPVVRHAQARASALADTVRQCQQRSKVLRDRVDDLQTQVQARRAALSHRRQVLATAAQRRADLCAEQERAMSAQELRLRDRWQTDAEEIASHRRALLRTVLLVFDLDERAIVGLALPSSAITTGVSATALQDKDAINAALLYTAHAVRLIAMYLGIRLPYRVNLGPKPFIRPSRAAESDPAHKRQALYLASSAAAVTPDDDLQRSPSASRLPFLKAKPASLAKESRPARAESYNQLAPALAMLAYDILFLANSQAIDVLPESHDAILSNLARLCTDESKTLGHPSHATLSSYLHVSEHPRVTYSSVLSLFLPTVETAAATAQAGRETGRDLAHNDRSEDEWDLVEVRKERPMPTRRATDPKPAADVEKRGSAERRHHHSVEHALSPVLQGALRRSQAKLNAQTK